ncbi:hypothetical protein ACFC7A_27250 [Streptomyces niveus]
MSRIRRWWAPAFVWPVGAAVKQLVGRHVQRLGQPGQPLRVEVAAQ